MGEKNQWSGPVIQIQNVSTGKLAEPLIWKTVWNKHVITSQSCGMLIMISKKYLLETPMHKLFYIWLEKGKEKNSALKAFVSYMVKWIPLLGILF